MDSSETTAAKQFSPQFSVKVSNAAKNGEVVEFFIETTKNGDDRATVVIRVHEDFVWLRHCLKTQDSIIGVIFPPLPSAPITSLQAAEKKTKKQAGSKAAILIGDNYEDDCKAAEKFLRLCTSHPRLGNSTVLEKFLCEKEAPARVRVRRGFLGSLSKAVDDIRLMNFKDSDEDFQQIRVSNTANIKHMKEATHTFQQIVDTEHRISNSYTEIQHSATPVSSLDSEEAVLPKICQILSQGADHAAEMSKVLAVNRCRTVGATLKLYDGYAEAQHEMLEKRVFKQIELESAKKTYEKAKPQKKQQAEDAMNKLDRELYDMTALAKPELERYNRQRVLAYQSSLIDMVESEIKTARDGLAVFTKYYAELQKLSVE